MKLGIKETKEVVLSIAKFGNAGGTVLEDGRISLTEYVAFLGPIMSLGDAIKDASQIPAELADLDADELTDLQTSFAAEFDIPEDAIEATVEEAVALAALLVKFLLRFRKTPVVVPTPAPLP